MMKRKEIKQMSIIMMSIAVISNQRHKVQSIQVFLVNIKKIKLIHLLIKLNSQTLKRFIKLMKIKFKYILKNRKSLIKMLFNRKTLINGLI